MTFADVMNKNSRTEAASGRRVSEPMDFAAIEKATGMVPYEVNADESTLLIAEHYARVDREVTSPLIARRLSDRMKEQCEVVAEGALLADDHPVFYCPERKKFFACQFSR
jgi:hypothetical protein